MYGDTYEDDLDYPQPPPPASAPTRRTYAWWTDPDTDPPEWMSDPNANPPVTLPAGKRWYWADDHWAVQDMPRYTGGGGEPPPTDGPPSIPTTYSGGGGDGDFDPSGFAWPRFNAPRYDAGPDFNAPPPFQFDAFTQPGFGDIFNDPTYKGRRDEGLQALEHGAAAKGLTRLPATLKALAGWNQDFASREYGNIFDRAADTWSMNRNNAADAYATNYGVSRDVFDRNRDERRFSFDQGYRGAKDMFDFNEWQPARMSFQDLYNRWKSELDATTSLATAGLD